MSALSLPKEVRIGCASCSGLVNLRRNPCVEQALEKIVIVGREELGVDAIRAELVKLNLRGTVCLNISGFL